VRGSVPPRFHSDFTQQVFPGSSRLPGVDKRRSFLIWCGTKAMSRGI
jgi:hypothetical protein